MQETAQTIVIKVMLENENVRDSKALVGRGHNKLALHLE